MDQESQYQDQTIQGKGDSDEDMNYDSLDKKRGSQNSQGNLFDCIQFFKGDQDQACNYNSKCYQRLDQPSQQINNEQIYKITEQVGIKQTQGNSGSQNFDSSYQCDEESYKININQNKGIKVKSKQFRDSKNMIKNLGKQIIAFIKNNKPLVIKSLASVHKWDNLKVYNQIARKLPKQSNFKDKIEQLRNLWTKQENFDFDKQLRIISHFFIRKLALNWIFSSRQIKNYSSHLKYRKKFLQILKNPNQFVYLKQKVVVKHH